MSHRSWIQLERDAPEHALPDDLRARDPMHGRDCGWVSQMRFFVRHFAPPGAVVFDPFCGFGTTLLAAALEGHRAHGLEVDAARAAIARERLQRHGIVDAPVVTGALPFTPPAGPFDICLTNVPYFGCEGEVGHHARIDPTHLRRRGPSGAQLYAAATLEAYLCGMREVFRAVRDRLPDGGWCIATCQNVVLGGARDGRGSRALPLAWEVARVLDSLFVAHEERVLCYPPRDVPGDAPLRSDHAAARTDRTHEYALVFRKERRATDVARTRRLHAELRRAGFAFGVRGSFVAWLDSDAPAGTPRPSDLDLLVPGDAATWKALLSWLVARGFGLTLWGERVNADVSIDTVRRHHYLRAERVDADGACVCIDLSVA